MNARTLGLLLALVLLLVLGAWLQGRRERAGAFATERPLLEGFDRSRLSSLRLEHLPRDLALEIERGEQGGWILVDPLRYPADPSAVEHLLSILSANRAEVRPETDLARLGLRPPEAVMHLREDLGGRALERRIEIGAVDLEGEDVFVRVDGAVLTTSRNLLTAVDRSLPDWRSRAVCDFTPDAVIEIRRAGTVEGASGPVDLSLEAAQDGAWRASHPFRGELDPGAVGALAASLAWLRASAFLEEKLASLEVLGLEPPPLRVEVGLVDGTRRAVRFAPASPAGSWLCVREGWAQVFRLAPEALGILVAPSEGFLERDVVRCVRDRISAVRLVAGARETSIERSGLGWRVTARLEGLTVLGPEPADTARVEDLLGAIEDAQVLEFPPEASWPAGSPRRALHVEADGDVLGGELGPAARGRDGAEGVLFRRDGDTVLGLIDARLAEVAATEPSSLRSLELHRARELDLAQIRIEGLGAAKHYERTEGGRWARSGSKAGATELELLVDALLAMRAVRLAAHDEGGELAERIDVRLIEPSNATVAYALARPTAGLEAEQGLVRYESGNRFAWVKGELHASLRELLRKP